jgi:membrane-associated phospholipid phosphatase
MIADPSPRIRTRAVLLFIVSAVMGVFFVVWTYFAVGQGPLFAFDQRCAEYWREHGVGWTWDVMVFMTDLGNVATQSMVAILAAVWQFSHGRRVFGTIWFGIVIGAGIGNVLLKTNLDRPRPPEEWRDRAVLERNESYPSGHAMGSTVSYGMLGYALARQTRFPLRRSILGLFFVLFIAGIGFSRIYLRAHWFSDVIGGYAAGLCWLCFCLGWIERKRRHHKTEVRATT